MITITRVVVSKRDSNPYKILIDPEHIRRMEERTDHADQRVKTMLICSYVNSPYQTEVIYTSDSFDSIRRKIARAKRGGAKGFEADRGETK